MTWEEWTDARRLYGNISIVHLRHRSAAWPDLPLLFSGVGYMRDANLTLSVCLRCRDGRETRDADLEKRGGQRLSQGVAAAFSESEAAQLGVQLRGVNCMSQCKRPCTIALSGRARFTYLFGDLDPEIGAADVLAVAAAYAKSATGLLPRNVRPDVLQAGILGRIPPLDFNGELIEPIIPRPSHHTQKDDVQ
ncbi:DUF1636 domain-containing protein [Tateyamaria sp. ANG-S1]|uniref:DUF1636 domain-containing protein n=1 Tax=Tateyamaria sp. ANG-S1 TaxID=1577905 RepID=UPI001269B686|nr:DUF1636 domain-containing protein [Tateyamaria sp. ANG-S1]